MTMTKRRRNRDNERRKGLGAALRGIFHGYGSYGATHKAILTIGRRVGLSSGKRKEGSTLAPSDVLNQVVKLRVDQIGPKAGITVSQADGRYDGKAERSVRVEVVDTGDDGTPAGFRRNVRRLAERVAGDLQQREVIVEITKPKTGARRSKRTDDRPATIETFTASPPGAPSPTDRDRFCAWVRKNSDEARAARTADEDGCFAPPKPARRRRRK